MRKKLMCALLCAAMAVALLAGCGSKPAVEQENASASDTQEAEEASVETTEESEQAEGVDTYFEKPVTLSYLTWTYADVPQTIDEWMEGCKEKFNIEIELQNMSGSDENYASTFLARLAADDLPDLVMLHRLTPAMYTDGGAQVDANTFVDISNLENVKNFPEGVISNVMRDGKLYLVPTTQNVLGVIYNKNVFADNGLDIPTDINQFMELMDTLKEKGIAPLAGSFADAWSTQIIPFIAWDNFVGRNDHDAAKKLYDESTDTSTMRWVGLEGAEETFALTKDWIDAGYFTDDPLATNVSVASQFLADGEAAMFITGSWVYPVALEACEEGVELGFFPLPLNEPGEDIYVPMTAPEGIAISAKSKNVEAAKIAYNYWLSEEIQQTLAEESGGVATHTGVALNAFAEETRAATENNYLLFPDLYTKSYGYCIPQDSPHYLTASYFQSILAETLTPAQLLEDLDASTAEVATIQ